MQESDNTIPTSEPVDSSKNPYFSEVKNKSMEMFKAMIAKKQDIPDNPDSFAYLKQPVYANYESLPGVLPSGLRIGDPISNSLTDVFKAAWQMNTITAPVLNTLFQDMSGMFRFDDAQFVREKLKPLAEKNISVQKFFEENGDMLRETEEGKFVLQQYLKGNYDSYDNRFDSLMNAIGFDFYKQDYQKVLANASGFNSFVSVGVSIADPIGVAASFVPFGLGLKAANIGQAIFRGAASGAASGAFFGIANEAVWQSYDPDRTMDESLNNLAIMTTFGAGAGAILGAAGKAVGSKLDFANESGSGTPGRFTGKDGKNMNLNSFVDIPTDKAINPSKTLMGKNRFVYINYEGETGIMGRVGKQRFRIPKKDYDEALNSYIKDLPEGYDVTEAARELNETLIEQHSITKIINVLESDYKNITGLRDAAKAKLDELLVKKGRALNNLLQINVDDVIKAINNQTLKSDKSLKEVLDGIISDANIEVNPYPKDYTLSLASRFEDGASDALEGFPKLPKDPIDISKMTDEEIADYVAINGIEPEGIKFTPEEYEAYSLGYDNSLKKAEVDAWFQDVFGATKQQLEEISNSGDVVSIEVLDDIYDSLKASGKYTNESDLRDAAQAEFLKNFKENIQIVLGKETTSPEPVADFFNLKETVNVESMSDEFSIPFMKNGRIDLGELRSEVINEVRTGKVKLDLSDNDFTDIVMEAADSTLSGGALSGIRKVSTEVVELMAKNLGITNPKTLKFIKTASWLFLSAIGGTLLVNAGWNKFFSTNSKVNPSEFPLPTLFDKRTHEEISNSLDAIPEIKQLNNILKDSMYSSFSSYGKVALFAKEMADMYDMKPGDYKNEINNAWLESMSSGRNINEKVEIFNKNLPKELHYLASVLSEPFLAMSGSMAEGINGKGQEVAAIFLIEMYANTLNHIASGQEVDGNNVDFIKKIMNDGISTSVLLGGLLNRYSNVISEDKVAILDEYDGIYVPQEPERVMGYAAFISDFRNLDEKNLNDDQKQATMTSLIMNDVFRFETLSKAIKAFSNNKYPDGEQTEENTLIPSNIDLKETE